MYIGDYLGRRSIYSPHKLAIVDTGKVPEWRFTYRQMNERANRLGNWLRAIAGVTKGDRVAILARDGVEHLDCFFACGKLGAIHTALNWRLHVHELEGLLRATRPRAMIFCDEFRTSVASLQAALKGTAYALEHLLHIDGSGVEGSLPYEDTAQASPDSPVVCESLQG
jgi:fatty-acyl-CoA synthase